MFPVTRNTPGGKGDRCVRLTTYHHYSAVVKKSRSLNSLDPSGPAWPVTGVLYLYNEEGLKQQLNYKTED